jgi:transcriptional regulator with XRE-family HTH domain
LLTVSFIDFFSPIRNTAGVDGLYKEFGGVLKKARREAGLTQQQVAERVGLTRTSITNIERGNQHIALHQLFLLASAIGRQPEELLPDQAAAPEDLLPADAVKLLSEAEDEESREWVARVMQKSGVQRPETEASVSK